MYKKKVFILFLLFTTFSFAQNVDIVSYGTGFNKPVCISNAGDNRLFIVEQDGIIKILESGTTLSTPFLDIDSIVGSSGNEQGLLGLAFHPNYSTNGYFYVNYTNNSGDTVISRYQVSSNPYVADVNSAQIILTIDQPYSNHNGGDLKFDSDGYLYIGTGDGGSGGDPDNYAQNTLSLLGKMLRIDVDNGSPYSIPSDNPFVSDSSVLDEIWATGLRNPWRFSFDRENGDLWIGDVGQNAFDEINHAPNGTAGLNYGWRCYEANATYNTTGCLGSSNYYFPVAEYSLGGTPYRCAVSGGFVYRGSNFPNFYGLYFFADYCSGEIATYNPSSNQVIYNSFSGNFSSFGEDSNGELYVADLGSGTIYRIIDTTASLNDDIIYNININPNPVKDTLYIESDNLTITKLEFFTSLGKKIKTTYNKNNIDLSTFENGVYFLRIYTKTKKIILKKIIKN